MKLLDLLFDRRCRLCDIAIDDGVVCGECGKYIEKLASVKKIYLTVNGRRFEARYLFDYDDKIIRKLLFVLKRVSDRELFEYASFLYQRLVPEDFSGVVTNCPIRATGIRKSGFDQVEKPCRILCRRRKLKFRKLLKRIGFSKEQKKLTRDERKLNVKGKFRVKTKDIPQNILIVDDVVTTGGTAIECAGEILKTNPDANISFAFLASRN